MTTINLLKQMAKTKSTDQNSANIINMYLVQDGDEGKYSQVAYPTPGATLASVGTTVMRALLTVHNITYGVDGSNFFSVDSLGFRTLLGTLNTSTGWAKIKSIAQQILIADGTNGYYYKIASNTFGVIQNSGQSVTSVTITNPGSGYTAATTVTFTGGSPAVVATGTVTIIGGQIDSVTITNGGSGYTSAPAVVFTDSGGGINAAGTALTQFNSFPTAIQDIECQDEFGLVLVANSQQWQSSSISDLTVWPALSFASTTGSHNYNVAMISCHREIYLLGTQTSEVWDNLGNANFTFGRNTSVFLEVGCAARSSVALANNTLFFLAQTPTGGTIVVSMNNSYTPTVISTPAIAYQISTYTTVSDAIGFAYQQEGHEFYILTFPTAGVTWAYDMTTQMWHQRASLVAGNQTKWLASCYTFNYNKQLIGDSNSGNIYVLDMTNNTENGAAITRTLVTHPFYNAGTWIYIDKLQVDFDNAPGAGLANWNLFVSRDGGRSFGSAKPAVPQVDAYGMYRVYWLRLGNARAYVLKLQTNANIQTIILGAWATVRGGDPV